MRGAIMQAIYASLYFSRSLISCWRRSVFCWILSLKSVRVSIMTTTKGEVITYNIVEFNNARKLYPEIHKKILSGSPIGETIHNSKSKFLRLEKCSFLFKLSKKLKELFKTRENSSSVKFVEVYIDKEDEDHKYATIIEIYSPKVGTYKEFEVNKGLIKKFNIVLDDKISRYKVK